MEFDTLLLLLLSSSSSSLLPLTEYTESYPDRRASYPRKKVIPVLKIYLETL